MLKDVVSWIDYSHFDQIALIIFATCFVAIVVKALMMTRDASDKLGAIPLTDEVVEPRSSNS